jgi:hypothetical protein
MLDFTQVVKRITQGQPAAEMTPLSAPQAESAEGGGAPAAGPAAAGGSQQQAAAAPGAPDARQVADKVYEMMRSDLRVLNERRGNW